MLLLSVIDQMAMTMALVMAMAVKEVEKVGSRMGLGSGFLNLAEWPYFPEFESTKIYLDCVTICALVKFRLKIHQTHVRS